MSERIPWSLRQRVLRDKRAWRRANNQGARHAYSWTERQLLHGSEHPARFLLQLVAMWGVLGLFLWTAAGELPWSESVPAELDYFSVLWTVQATLAALVYPIVISFVAVFLQKRPLAQALIKLYLLDSSALAAGVSSLGLVLVMGVQYLLVPMTGLAVWRSFVVLDALWFLINALVTTRFLLRTVAFLRPESQLDVVMRYVANVALPRQIENLHLYNVLGGAQERGWLPGGGQAISIRREKPAIYLYPGTFDEGATKASINFAGKRTVCDIRLWPLALALRWWMATASKSKKGGTPSTLTYMAVPGRTYEDGLDYLSISGSTQANLIQRWLIRVSVKMRKSRALAYDASIVSILDEFEADALAGLRAEDAPRFESSLGALAQLHELLLRLSNFRQDEGLVESWAQLSELRMFPYELHREWSERYRSLFEQAVLMLERDSAPFRKLVRIPQKVHSNAVASSPSKVREDLARLPVQMMHILGGWWVDRVEERGIVEHDYRSMITLPAPLHRRYEACVVAFVSAWEENRYHIAQLPSVNRMVWGGAATVSWVNQVHVRETASLLLGAVSRGDRVAAEWLADVLNKWWGSLEYEHPPMTIYSKAPLVVVPQLSETWPEVERSLGLSDEALRWVGDSEQSLQRGVLLAALQNYWSDVRLLTVELLMSWILRTAPSKLRDSLTFEIVVGLLEGRDWKGGGTITEALSQVGPQDYLWAKMRQYFVSDGPKGYSLQLDTFVERARESNVSIVATSRTYIRHGAEDMDALRDSVVAILVLLSNVDWSPDELTYGKLDEWVVQGHARIERVNRVLNEWITVIDQAKPQQGRAISILLHRLGRAGTVVERGSRVRRVLCELRDRIARKHANAIKSALISPARLHQVAMYAQVRAFDAKEGEFPLNLFDEVGEVSADLEKFGITVGVRKGELTDVELESRAINEASFWESLVADYVGAILMSDVLQRVGVREVTANDAHAYWESFKSETAGFIADGMHPILVLDNRTRPDWVWEWMHPDADNPPPVDFRYRRKEGQGDGYVGHFNEVPVFSGRIEVGRSILVASECFGRAQFTVDPEGAKVHADVVREDDEKQVVDVRLTFSRSVDGELVRAVSLVYEPPSERPAEKAG